MTQKIWQKWQKKKKHKSWKEHENRTKNLIMIIYKNRLRNDPNNWTKMTQNIKQKML